MSRRPAADDVVVERGSLDRLASLVGRHAPAARYAVVSDANVAPRHGGRATAALRGAGCAADLVTIRAGEDHKTPAAWAELLEALAGLGLGRDGCIVAVGGGVTGDLAGFTAATFARGIPLVQVPTSLLAMVDAALGGKTGLDLRAGKNLAGAFHRPRLVVIDADTLDTLPDAELADGMAEAVKHGAIADAAYLEGTAAGASAVLAREADAVDRLIAGSVRIKTDIVGRDPRESGERAVLNFGHTIAHAIERATDYSVRHGRAVALGLVAEAALGEAVAVSRPGTAATIRDALAACGLPVDLAAAPRPGELLRAARSDKKARRGALRYVLLREPGAPARDPAGDWTHAVSDDVVAATLETLRGASGPTSGEPRKV